MKKFRICLCILTVGLVSCSGGEKSQNIDTEAQAEIPVHMLN